MIFYIDTSSNYLYTGIVDEGILLSERKLNLSHDLSTFTISSINEMFNEVKIKPNSIKKIIVVDGPGSFTGIRIGITIAKVFAYTFKKKICVINSLEAMAISSDSNKVLVPIIDARRGYVYASAYLNEECILKSQYISLEKLKLYLIGNKLDYEYISNDSINGIKTSKYNPNILKIVSKYQNRRAINPHLVEPVYLKLTEAEENKLKELS